MSYDNVTQFKTMYVETGSVPPILLSVSKVEPKRVAQASQTLHEAIDSSWERISMPETSCEVGHTSR
jgi:hypothetical protein